jgi:hypothetical protein
MVFACRSGGGFGDAEGDEADECKLGLSVTATPFHPKKEAIRPGDLGASVADAVVSGFNASAVTPICIGGCKPVVVLLCSAMSLLVLKDSSGCDRECECCGTDGEYIGGNEDSAIGLGRLVDPEFSL